MSFSHSVKFRAGMAENRNQLLWEFIAECEFKQQADMNKTFLEVGLEFLQCLQCLPEACL